MSSMRLKNTPYVILWYVILPTFYHQTLPYQYWLEAHVCVSIRQFFFLSHYDSLSFVTHICNTRFFPYANCNTMTHCHIAALLITFSPKSPNRTNCHVIYLEMWQKFLIFRVVEGGTVEILIENNWKKAWISQFFFVY